MKVRRSSKRVVLWALIVLAVGLLSYAAFGAWQYYRATNHTDVSLPSAVVTTSTTTPEETVPVEACRDYKVAPSQPRKLIIPSIGVDACIQQVGRDENGAIAVPTNIHVAGWFVESALPGAVGNSIIDGHVLGRYANALFVDLGTLQKGAAVTIEFGDGTTKEFEVVDRQTYSVQDAAKVLFQQQSGVDRQLTLITCGGTFDKKAQTYDQRVIVRAQLR